MARKRKTWRFRLNEATTLEVLTPAPATEKQVRRRGRWSLILGTLVAALMVSAVAGAAVWTDQQDYAPGSVVTITGDNSDGAGYLAGETVVVDVSGPNGYHASCEAVADENGAWSCQVTLWDSELAEGSYSYTATGSTSGVSETGSFTDHGPSPVTASSYAISANTSHLVTASVTLGGGSSTVTLSAATAKVANVTAGGTTDVILTGPGGNGNGSWSGSFQGVCATNYKVNNVVVTWSTGHDHSSTQTPSGTVDVTTASCATPNSAPTANAGGPYSVGEGSSVALSGSGSDPDGDPLTYAWDLDNNGTFETPGQNPTFSAAGRDGPDTQTIVLRVCDDESACATSSAAVSITNVPPSITSVTNDGPVNEGSPATITVTATDPAGVLDPLSYEFDCDNNSVYEVGPQSGNSAQCTYPDGPSSHIVNVRVTDGDGGEDTDSTAVTVNNVPPTVVAGFTAVSVNCQTTATLTIDPDDVGVNDSPWKVNINWGDGNIEPEISRTNLNSFTVTHVYALAGVYNATVSVTDKDNGTGSDLVNGITINQTYTVDFLPPFDDSNPSGLIVNKMKNGRVVPVKATIYDDCGRAYVTDPGADVTIKVSKTSGTGTGDPIEEYADAGESSAGTNQFRWTDGFWIYNLDSKGLGLIVNNLYRVDIYVGLVRATVANWAVLQPVK